MKDFKKSDLKPGMAVQLKNGNRGLVMDGYILCNSSAIMLSDYSSDLLMSLTPRFTKKYRKDFHDLDIEIVFDFAPCLDLDNIIVPVLWKREGIKEVTIEDIEKKFGCKVKIVSKI